MLKSYFQKKTNYLAMVSTSESLKNKIRISLLFPSKKIRNSWQKYCLFGFRIGGVIPQEKM